MEHAAPTAFDRAALLAHIAALEAELACYLAKYGLTDEARRLLVRSPAAKPPA